MREKILLRRLVAPKRVTLPNGQSFVARYERVSRKNLRRNITAKKYRKLDQDHEEELKKVAVL